MVEDNPLQNELEELASFCRKFPKIYIYEHELVQRLISKYLYYAKIPIQGFVKAEVCAQDHAGEPFPVINLLQLKENSTGGGYRYHHLYRLCAVQSRSRPFATGFWSE